MYFIIKENIPGSLSKAIDLDKLVNSVSDIKVEDIYESNIQNLQTKLDELKDFKKSIEESKKIIEGINPLDLLKSLKNLMEGLNEQKDSNNISELNPKTCF
ncbi:MAG: hypothetical protein HC831_07030 [Chloroflexia bacterium]|nr:hypothetical protein [Chloroflexia bacterium]